MDTSETSFLANSEHVDTTFKFQHTGDDFFVENSDVSIRVALTTQPV